MHAHERPGRLDPQQAGGDPAEKKPGGALRGAGCGVPEGSHPPDCGAATRALPADTRRQTSVLHGFSGSFQFPAKRLMTHGAQKRSRVPKTKGGEGAETTRPAEGLGHQPATANNERRAGAAVCLARPAQHARQKQRTAQVHGQAQDRCSSAPGGVQGGLTAHPPEHSPEEVKIKRKPLTLRP